MVTCRYTTRRRTSAPPVAPHTQTWTWTDSSTRLTALSGEQDRNVMTLFYDTSTEYIVDIIIESGIISLDYLHTAILPSPPHVNGMQTLCVSVIHVAQFLGPS